MSYKSIEVEKQNKGVTWLYINNEPVNAIDDILMDELEEAADQLENDEETRVIVIASRHEKIFLAGADLKGLMAGTGPSDDGSDPIAMQSARMQRCFDRFARLKKPVIAAINGHAFGGGCELALACDFRIMSEGKIGLTELSLGIIPGAGGTQRMVQVVGRAKAIDLIFHAKRLTKEEAYEIGLITKAVDNLEEETTEFAERLADGAINSMGLAKQAINAAHDLSMEDGLKEEAKLFSETFTSDEPAIGLAAFFQKEKPNFNI